MLDALREGAAPGSLGASRGAKSIGGIAGAGEDLPDLGGVSFKDALGQALGSVSATQNASANLQRRYTAGDPMVSLEQTMIAMQKSQIAFQGAVTVRNRLVSAYTDIMNMSV